jgi:hypothetical protein
LFSQTLVLGVGGVRVLAKVISRSFSNQDCHQIILSLSGILFIGTWPPCAFGFGIKRTFFSLLLELRLKKNSFLFKKH